MKPSEGIVDFIKSFEGLFLNAYQDEVGVWTIGWGTIRYPNGVKVKHGDTCTQEQAQEYLDFEVNQKGEAVTKLIKETPVNQKQFDALTSFAYNLGEYALEISTLLEKLLINPHDATIYQYTKDANGKPVIKSCEFLKWVYAGKQILNGLVRRRAAEADWYKS